MNKAWWWIVAIISLIGLAFFGAEKVGLGFLFILCAVGIAAIVIWVQQKKSSEIQADEQRLWEKGFPITYAFNVGHYTGAYEYEQWHEGYPDSAGGWDVSGGVKNISPYGINYIYLYAYPVDRIGTKVAKTDIWKYTGPFEQGKMKLIRSDHNWYDLSVASVELEKIVVDYDIAGTQVTSAPASFFALHGHGISHESWVARKPAQDGTWDLKSVIYYQAEKTSDRVVLFVVPLDTSGNELATAMECSSRSHKKKNDIMTVWWSGLWKGLPVARVRIKKFKIEFTDGTNQIVEF